MVTKTEEICKEVSIALRGKDDIIRKILMAILARGHVLLEDIPGVGKTTMAQAFRIALGLSGQRISFTPDVVPSDITGFTMYDKNKGEFCFRPGSIMCNLFLADEINRTSSKTQSALLEVMQEGKVTVDGQSYPVPEPFIVIATQNPVGASGTQMLPEAQLDRFMVSLSIGYPDKESQIELLRSRQKTDPLHQVRQILDAERTAELQNRTDEVFISDEILGYVTDLTERTRTHEAVRLGISPRGALAVCRMAKANAFMHERDYVIPQDVAEVFCETCQHRLVLLPNARLKELSGKEILRQILSETPSPES